MKSLSGGQSAGLPVTVVNSFTFSLLAAKVRFLKCLKCCPTYRS